MNQTQKEEVKLTDIRTVILKPRTWEKHNRVYLVGTNTTGERVWRFLGYDKQGANSK